MADDLIRSVAAHLRAHSCGARTVVPTSEPYFLEAAEVAVRVIGAQRLYAALRNLLVAAERHVFGDECKAERDEARAALDRITPEWCANMAKLEIGYEVGAGILAIDPVPDDCPHAAPFRYCEVCKVDPCPIGLGPLAKDEERHG